MSFHEYGRKNGRGQFETVKLTIDTYKNFILYALDVVYVDDLELFQIADSNLKDQNFIKLCTLISRAISQVKSSKGLSEDKQKRLSFLQSKVEAVTEKVRLLEIIYEYQVVSKGF